MVHISRRPRPILRRMVLILTSLAMAVALVTPALAGGRGSGGTLPPPPPDFLVAPGTDAGAFVPGFPGVLVAGGFLCPGFYGCSSDWEPRFLNVPELGFAGYVGGRIGFAPQNGFSGTITLQLLNLPPGITSQTATSVTIAGANVFTPLKLQAASTTAPGNYFLTVRATSGALVHEAQFPITVADSLRPPHPAVSLPFSVVGGGQYTGNVEVSAPAPVGGLVANLSTSDPAVVTVQPSVTIPAGSTSATFTFSTLAVTAQQAPSILAAISPDGWPGSDIMFVVPASVLSQVALSPSSVVGGNSAALNVALTGAVAEPAVLSLSSSNPAVATVPASVTIPAGSSGISLSVATAAVSASTSVAISVTFNGVTQTAFLGVTAAAPLPPPPGGVITVKQAQYDGGKHILQVEVTSSILSAGETRTAFVTSTGQTIGMLTDAGGGTFKGQFAWPVNPQQITIASSLGWAATAFVTTK